MADGAKLKIVAKGRQEGFSFCGSFRGVRECVARKQDWIFLSKGERQSRLLMEKVHEHLKAVNAIQDFLEREFALESEDQDGRRTVKQLEVRLKNGSTIYGLPANPDTARGYSGNVTLDEFAFHRDSRKIYAALYPTILRGYSIELISTPNGASGMYYEIAKEAGLVPGYARKADSYWSAHFVDIYAACMQGLADTVPPVPAPPKEWIDWAARRFAQRGCAPSRRSVNFTAALRAGAIDEETWQQEFEGVFLSDAANYIPMELIVSCESELASTDYPPDWDAAGRELSLGVDIGRKRDLTIAWLFEKIGDVMWSRRLLALKGQTFDAQEKAISDVIDAAKPRRVSVDQSGLGMMLAERLANKYGGAIEPVQFTAQVKERLAPLVKQAFENRTLRIPDNRDIRTDIHAVKRFVTPAGNIRFDAEHTDRGHADRFWALALALNAATQPVSSLADGICVGAPRAAEYALEALGTEF